MGACFHTDAIQCDNCRPRRWQVGTDQPLQPYQPPPQWPPQPMQPAPMPLQPPPAYWPAMESPLTLQILEELRAIRKLLEAKPDPEDG